MKHRAPNTTRRRVFVSLLFASLVFGQGLIFSEAAAPLLAPSTLAAGDVAIIGYNTDDPGGTPSDTISFVLLAPIGSGTQIFFTDRSWNGTIFAAASGDGTFTYTAGVDVPTGTIVTITQAQLSGAGMSLLDSGETIYAYQGATNAPTGFLYAADIADNNTTFNGSLANTGLSVASGTATAIAGDSGTFGDRGHNIARSDLRTAISSPTNWTSNDDSPQNPMTGNLLSAPDQYVFSVIAGDAGLLRMSRDGADVATQALHQFQTNPVPATQFNHPNDIVFDTVHGLFFIADSDTGNRRVLQGNIADLFNPGTLPTLTALYSDPNPATSNGQINGLAIDIDHTADQGALYFVNQDDLKRVVYDHDGTSPTNQTAVILGSVPVGAFANELALDIATGRAWIMSTASSTGAVEVPAGTPGAIFDPDCNCWYIVGTDITNNEIYQISNIARSDSDATGNTLSTLDLDSASGGTDLPDAKGLLSSIDNDPVSGHIYFVTSQINNGVGGALGGIYRYSLTTGTVETLYTETNATDYDFNYIDVDPASGRYYISNVSFESPGDPNGTSINTSSIFVHALSAGTPTVFHANAGNINSAAPWGLIVDNAPTLTVTSADPTYTEQQSSPATVQLITSASADDVDTGPLTDELAGATVRISSGFFQGVDTLSFTNSGGITGNYNSTTGILTFTGASTFDSYETVLASVRFQATGDNPTNYGTNQSRTLSWSVTDGLMSSDEQTSTVTVVGVNDPPVNNSLVAQTVTEDTGKQITFSVSDVDADPANQDITVRLLVTLGTIDINTAVGGGVTAGDVTGDNTNNVLLTGTQNEINATLGNASGAVYHNVPDYNGADTLTVTTDDQGHTGTPGAFQDVDQVAITINAVADITADALVTKQNTPITANLITGTIGATADTFENGGRALTSVTQGTNGGVAFAANGDVTYTPNALFFGVDTFTYTVTSGGVTETANVTVTVVAPPQISKAFAADFVSKNGSVNLAFTIVNPNLGTALTVVAFTDPLPVGLNVADGSQSGCNGTVTRVTATRTISLAGGSIPANSNCQFTVAVTAGTTDVLLTNTTGAVSSSEGGTGNAATDTITVIDPPSLAKSFTPSVIAVSTASTLQFTLSNPNTTLSLTGLSFTDSLPAGATTPDAGATTVCGNGSYSVAGNVIGFSKPSLAAGAENNCVFSVTVTGATVGTKTNTTSVVDTSNSNDGTAATAALTVLGPPTVLKSFAASPINIGATTTMSFQLNNPNAGNALTDVGFQDALPAGITVAGAGSPQCGGTVEVTTSSVTFSGGTLAGGATCTVTVTVRGVVGGSWTNTATNVVSLDGGPGVNSNTAPIVVTNHPPAGTNNTVTATEDAAYTLTAADFGFTDPNDAPPQTLLAVKISTLPALGTLTNNNVTVNAGDVIPVATIDGGLLKFMPAADGFGAPYTSFTFQVQDNGGGTDLDLSPNTLIVNVTGVNDPPSFTIAGDPPTVAQYAGPQTVLNFATSISAGPNETGQVLTFNISPSGSTGTLTFSCAPAIDATTGTLTYTPTNGTYGTATFSVTLGDDAGGSDTSAPQSFTIVVIQAAPLMDLNGDSIGDVFTYNSESGAWKRAISQGDGTFVETDGSWNPGWSVAPAKFNPDNFTDLFLFNPVSGQWARMLNDGGSGFTTQATGTWWNGWQRFVMDLDADGLSDLFLHDPASGIWFKCLPSETDFDCTVGYWDADWEVTPMMLNADAYGDLFIFNGTTGRWFWVLGQAGESFTYPVTDVWYNGWDRYPGDYNADGLTDLLLHDQGTGAYWTAMNNGSGTGFTFTGGYWTVGWTPYVGDLDADGDSDLLLYHHPTGHWYKMLSDGVGGYVVGFSQTWSEGWTIHVTELNGDGRADIVLYHPVTGVYYQVLNLGAGDFTYTSGTWNPGLTIVVRSPFF